MNLKKALLVICIGLLPFSFAEAMEKENQPVLQQTGETTLFKVGFEFQESNHLLNQGSEKAPKSLDDKYIKKPLVEFVDATSKEKIFHIEADDLDLEIVTVPFPSDINKREAVKNNFDKIQIFINLFYKIVIESNQQLYLSDVLDKIQESQNFKDANMKMELNKDTPFKEIKILKKEGDFIPGFKPQFSIQTNLSNFLLYYFYIFASERSKILSGSMEALSRVVTKVNLENNGTIDLTNNFILLYLYTCISPEVFIEIEKKQGGIIQAMKNCQQCDYKIYLPIMSRVSFSELAQNIGDWQGKLMDKWPSDIYNKYKAIGFYDFGDFYDPKTTKKLIEHLDINSFSDYDSSVECYNSSLERGMITTGILRKLKDSAFFQPGNKKNHNFTYG